MSMRNSNIQYGAVSKAIHWLMGLTIIGLLAVGLYMEGLDASPLKFQIYGLHKAIGIAVLAVFFVRVFWRFTNIVPDSLPSHRAWEKFLAHSVHVFLYVAMIGMPLSGWMMSSAAGYPVEFFGLFTLPHIVPESESLGDLMREIHALLGCALMAALGLHIAGALKHHFIDKDNTLRRMIPDGILGSIKE